MASKKIDKNKEKIIDTSTKPKRTSKSPTSGNNLFFFRQVPVPDYYIDKIAEDLVAWVDNPPEGTKTYKLNQFLRTLSIHPDTFYTILKRSEKLRWAHSYAMAAIADVREIGALENKLSERTVLQSMPIYSKEWKDLEEWRAKLKDEETKTAGNFKIVMTSIPGDKTDDKA